MLKADAPLGFPNRTHPAQISGELLPGGASAVGDLLAGHNGGDERGQDHRSGNTGPDYRTEYLAGHDGGCGQGCRSHTQVLGKRTMVLFHNKYQPFCWLMGPVINGWANPSRPGVPLR